MWVAEIAGKWLQIDSERATAHTNLTLTQNLTFYFSHFLFRTLKLPQFESTFGMLLRNDILFIEPRKQTAPSA